LLIDRFLLASSFQAEVNAGIYGYLTKSAMLKTKNHFWPQISTLISSIKLEKVISGEGFKLKNIDISLKIEKESDTVNLSETDNTLQLVVDSTAYSGSVNFEFGVAPLHLSGIVKIKGTFGKVSASASLSSVIEGQGNIPSVNITAIEAAINDDVDVTIEGTE